MAVIVTGRGGLLGGRRLAGVWRGCGVSVGWLREFVVDGHGSPRCRVVVPFHLAGIWFVLALVMALRVS